MEHILTFAGCSQLVLCLWVMDWIASVPALILGTLLFGVLVTAVRRVLRQAHPQRRRIPCTRKMSRII